MTVARSYDCGQQPKRTDDDHAPERRDESIPVEIRKTESVRTSESRICAPARAQPVAGGHRAEGSPRTADAPGLRGHEP